MMMIPIYSKWTYLYSYIILYIYIHFIIDMISQMAPRFKRHPVVKPSKVQGGRRSQEDGRQLGAHFGAQGLALSATEDAVIEMSCGS